jgi:hypothetical protein
MRLHRHRYGMEQEQHTAEGGCRQCGDAPDGDEGEAVQLDHERTQPRPLYH